MPRVSGFDAGQTDVVDAGQRDGGADDGKQDVEQVAHVADDRHGDVAPGVRFGGRPRRVPRSSSSKVFWVASSWLKTLMTFWPLTDSSTKAFTSPIHCCCLTK